MADHPNLSAVATRLWWGTRWGGEVMTKTMDRIATVVGKLKTRNVTGATVSLCEAARTARRRAGICATEMVVGLIRTSRRNGDGLTKKARAGRASPGGEGTPYRKDPTGHWRAKRSAVCSAFVLYRRNSRCQYAHRHASGIIVMSEDGEHDRDRDRAFKLYEWVGLLRKVLPTETAINLVQSRFQQTTGDDKDTRAHFRGHPRALRHVLPRARRRLAA